MLQTLVNALKTPELRKKILYTAFIILIFRIGAAISVPFTNAAQGIIDDTTSAGNFMNYLNMMTGDAFNYSTLFAMSITPYINQKETAADHPSRRGRHRGSPVHRILLLSAQRRIPLHRRERSGLHRLLRRPSGPGRHHHPHRRLCHHDVAW